MEVSGQFNVILAFLLSTAQVHIWRMSWPRSQCGVEGWNSQMTWEWTDTQQNVKLFTNRMSLNYHPHRRIVNHTAEDRDQSLHIH